MRTEVPDRSRPAGNVDVRELVRDFARGLVALHDDLDRTGQVLAPYPESLARAFNLASAARVMGHPASAGYPTDLRSLLRAAEQPLFRWAPSWTSKDDDSDEQGSSGNAAYQVRLLENSQPTGACLDLAMPTGTDPEHAFYAALMDRCEAMGDRSAQSFYTAWRRVVIERPVAQSHAEILMQPGLIECPTVTRELIRFFYKPVPQPGHGSDHVLLCPVTGTRMTNVSGRLQTESRDPDVRRSVTATEARQVAWTPQMIELERPVRIFWTLPGYHEIALERAALEAGYLVEMWPSLDKVDLLIRHQSKKVVYAVDVKDYLSPARLARAFQGFASYRRHRRVLVVPDYVMQENPNYGDLFDRIRKERGMSTVTLESLSRFVKRLRADDA